MATAAGAPGAVPYAMEMDPDKARELAQRGGALLLLDVPAGTAIGIDHQMFLSGPKFCGVKMIPPGPHLLTYYAINATPSGFSPPNVRWLHLATAQVAVLRWDAELELLAGLQDEEEAERYEAGVRRFDFDAGMAPYNLPAFAVWQDIAGSVTEELMKRVMPRCGTASVVAEARVAGVSTDAEARLDEQLREGEAEGAVPEAQGGVASAAVQSGKLGACTYTPVPIKVSGPGMTPAQVTAANLDRSAQLEALLRDRFGGEEAALLGEFQMAFVNFVIGHSLAGYAQWKDFLHLMCTCGNAATGCRAGLVTSWARTLRKQLQVSLAPSAGSGPEAGGSGMSDATPFGVPMVEELLATSFLKPLLGGWFEDLGSSAGVPGELQSEVRKLRAVLSRRLGLDFDVQSLGEDEDDEYAPVVVEM